MHILTLSAVVRSQWYLLCSNYSKGGLHFTLYISSLILPSLSQHHSVTVFVHGQFQHRGQKSAFADCFKLDIYQVCRVLQADILALKPDSKSNPMAASQLLGRCAHRSRTALTKTAAALTAAALCWPKPPLRTPRQLYYIYAQLQHDSVSSILAIVHYSVFSWESQFREIHPRATVLYIYIVSVYLLKCKYNIYI